MTARVAPTAALPNASARSSTSLKFSAALSPRPPAMMTGASPRSSLPSAALDRLVHLDARRCRIDRRLRSFSTRPAFAFCAGAMTFGRIATTAGEPAIASVAITLPDVHRMLHDDRVAARARTRVTSATMLTPSFAATRGARSRPCAECRTRGAIAARS